MIPFWGGIPKKNQKQKYAIRRLRHFLHRLVSL